MACRGCAPFIGWRCPTSWVSWVRGDAAGFQFERALHPDVFEILVHEHAVARPRLISDLEPEVEAVRLGKLKRALRVA